MFDNFLEILFLIKYPLIGLAFVLTILSFYWNTVFKFFKLKKYENIQRVHEKEISRLGGLAIYTFFWIIFFFGFFKDKLFFNILISSIPFVLISLKEDLFHNSNPKIRLLLMILSCLIFFFINPIEFPIIDFPIFGEVISLYPVNIIFFTFSILVFMNGMNLIDGMNGLFGFTTLFILLGICIFALSFNDFELANIIILFSIPIIIFLFFNYPFGKIFVGDLGAYFYGFVTAILTIYLFGKYVFLISWIAVLLLFYPCMELLFSFIRKLKASNNPLDADDKHLHTLIYKRLVLSGKDCVQSNYLTTIFLFIFWIQSFIISLLVPINIIYIIGLILLLKIIYIIFYKIAKFEK